MTQVRDSAPPAPLSVTLFGAFHLAVAGETVPPPRARAAGWILVLLILRRGEEVDRQWLAETLWPKAEMRSALFNLRRNLTELRKMLGAEATRVQSPTVRTLRFDLNDVACDLIAFEALTARKDKANLQRAVALYRGDLLEGCHEEWLLPERVVYEHAYLKALEDLADHAIQEGDLPEATQRLQRLLTCEPLREDARCRLMEILADVGDLAGVEKQYRELRLLLHRELNLEPAPATTALYQRLRYSARTHQAVTPTSLTLSSTRHLPCPLTPLIGRTQERQEILQAKGRTRLLTLTGIGGVGKTRLAIAVAEEREADYPDGVWFVDLSSLQDPALLPQTVARALEVRAGSGHTFEEALLQSLRPKRLLLVMDNCEQVIESCALWVKQILQECPDVHCLCTSRQPLQISGETIWPVEPLPIPPAEEPEFGKDGNIGELRYYDSVALLLDRAATVMPPFRLTPYNAGAVVRICRNLDGIPLAIELAAARLRSLSIQEIAARLEDRFRLLTTGDRTLPRHQTLQAALDWSYDLLDTAERSCLRHLSVFAGGWTLDAAEAVTGEALDALTSLVDRSFVVHKERETGQRRYRLLETVRAYAREKLRESGEWEGICLRHRDYFLTFAEEARPKLRGAEQAAWLEFLEDEHDNLRQALISFTADTEGPESGEKGLRLGAALQRFWWTRGHLREGRERLSALLTHPGGQAPTRARAEALQGAGSLAMMQGDHVEARSRFEECLSIQRVEGHPQGIAYSLSSLGRVAGMCGDYTAARSLFEESLALHREMGEQQGIANSLSNLGTLAYLEGDYTRAQSRFAEGLTIQRALGDMTSVGLTLYNLGAVACDQGDYATARTLGEESLTIHRQLGDMPNIASSLCNLGNVASDQGHYVAARSLYEESLTIHRQLGDRHGIALSLVNQGKILVKQSDFPAAHSCLEECFTLCRELGERRVVCYGLEYGAELSQQKQQAEQAIRLWGAASALRETTGCPVPPQGQAAHDRNLADLRVAMGQDTFAVAWAEGRAMTMEQAIHLIIANR